MFGTKRTIGEVLVGSRQKMLDYWVKTGLFWSLFGLFRTFSGLFLGSFWALLDSSGPC